MKNLAPSGASSFQATKLEVDKAIELKSLWLQVELSRMTGANFSNKAEQRLGVPYMQGRDWPSEPWKRLHHSLGRVGAAQALTKGTLFEEVSGTLIPRLRWALEGTPFPMPNEDDPRDEDESS